MNLAQAMALMADGDEPSVFERLESDGMPESERLELAVRVLAGRSVYGVLRLGGDTRDWAAEAHQEYLDMRFYQAAADVKAGVA